MLFMVATIRYADGDILAYRIYDSASIGYEDIDRDILIKRLGKDLLIYNLKMDSGEIVCTDADINSYTAVRASGDLIGTRSSVILYETNEHYVIYTKNGQAINLKKGEVLDYAIKCKLANGKVTIQNGEYKFTRFDDTSFRNEDIERVAGINSKLLMLGSKYKLNDSYGVILKDEKMEVLHIKHPARYIPTKAAWGRDDIKEVRMADSVTYIGEAAFESCEELRKINITGNLGNAVFQKCYELEEVQISPKVKELGSCMFAYCESLKEIDISSVNNVGINIFNMCRSLRRVILGNIEKITMSMFQKCIGLEQIDIPSTVKTIDDFAFEECIHLKEIIIPNSVTRISYSAFRGCKSLEKVHLPESVTHIDEHAFRDCVSLKEIVIPKNVTHIGEGAFSGCSGLKKVQLPSSIREINNGVFQECKSLECIDLKNVEVIGNNAFRDCDSLTNIDIKAKSIGTEAFIFCDKLGIVKIDSGIEQIGKAAFKYCDDMLTIRLPIDCKCQSNLSKDWIGCRVVID